MSDAGKNVQQPARKVASTLNYDMLSEGGRPIPSDGGPAALDLKKIKWTGGTFTSNTTAAKLSTMFNYDGTPIDFAELAQGSEGRVLSGHAGGVSFAVKMQKCDDEAISGIRAAEALADCDLVSFRAFQNTSVMTVTSEQGTKLTFNRNHDLVTFMGKMDADCATLYFSGNTPEDIAGRGAFVAFMDKLLACLKEHGVAYPDMKPQNVGYTRNQTIQFRLIDLDGLNGTVATYPATTDLAALESPFYDRNRMTLQTEYAFEITKLLVFGHSWRPFIHTSKRLQAGKTDQVLRNIIRDQGALAEVRIAATKALRLLLEITELG
mgnify:CR=1 FL=1